MSGEPGIIGQAVQQTFDKAAGTAMLPARILAKFIPCGLQKYGTAVSAGFMAVNPVFWILPLFLPIVFCIVMAVNYYRWAQKGGVKMGKFLAFFLSWLTTVFLLWLVMMAFNRKLMDLIRGGKCKTFFFFWKFTLTIKIFRTFCPSLGA